MAPLNVILDHTSPSPTFLCPSSANKKYGLEFLLFEIRDYSSKKVIFSVDTSDGASRNRESIVEPDLDFNSIEFDEAGVPRIRKVKYTVSEDILCLPCISTSLTFKVGGNEPISNLRLIERLYFREKLIKSYDCTFGYCIPGSTNQWDCIYDLPPLKYEIVEEMIDSPFETVSDTFYFAGEELIMHNKAAYKYIREGNQEEKSYNFFCNDVKRVSVQTVDEESKCWYQNRDYRADSKEDFS